MLLCGSYHGGGKASSHAPIGCRIRGSTAKGLDSLTKLVPVTYYNLLSARYNEIVNSSLQIRMFEITNFCNQEVSRCEIFLRHCNHSSYER